MNAILQSLLGIPPFVQDLSNLELLDNVHPQCLYKLVSVISTPTWPAFGNEIGEDVFSTVHISFSDAFTMSCFARRSVRMLM